MEDKPSRHAQGVLLHDGLKSKREWSGKIAATETHEIRQRTAEQPHGSGLPQFVNRVQPAARRRGTIENPAANNSSSSKVNRGIGATAGTCSGAL